MMQLLPTPSDPTMAIRTLIGLTMFLLPVAFALGRIPAGGGCNDWDLRFALVGLFMAAADSDDEELVDDDDDECVVAPLPVVYPDVDAAEFCRGRLEVADAAAAVSVMILTRRTLLF